MVTTFSPPVKAKKKASVKLPVLPIALGVVAVALLALFIKTNGQLAKTREASTELTDAVVMTAKAAGLDTVTPEALADLTNGPIVLASVSTAVSERVAELAAARAELEQVKTSVGRLETEGQTAQEQLTALRAQMEAARGEAKAKADEVVAVQKKSAGQIAELNATIDDLKTQLETVSATSGAADSEVEEVKAVDAVVESESPAVDEAVDVSTNAAPADAETPVVDVPKGSNQAAVIPEGKSSLFKSVRYNAAKSQLVFLTLDDQVITYSDVPGTLMDELVAAPIFDIYYRFKVMDVYASEPKDRDIIRSVAK